MVFRMPHVQMSVGSFPGNTPWALRGGSTKAAPGEAAGMGRLTRPPKDASADPASGTSLGKRVFADMTKFGIARRDHPGLKVGPTSSKCPYEKQERRPNGDGHVKRERRSHTPRKPWGHRHTDEARKQLPRAFGMHGSADALTSDFWAQPPNTRRPQHLDLGLVSPQAENRQSHVCYVSAATHRTARWVRSRATEIGVVRYSSDRMPAQWGVM